MKRLFALLFLLAAIGGLIYLKDPAASARWAAYYFPRFFGFKESEGTLKLYGNVDIRQVDLGFRVKGRVVSMPFQEGDFVQANALMAILDKQPYEDAVLQQEARVESAKASLENATTLLKRRKILMGTGGISDQDIDDAAAAERVDLAALKEAVASLGVARTNLNDTELYAPDNGTILTRIREPGTVVKEADPIYTLSLISPVWVRTYVSERQLGLIYPGMAAEIYTDSSEEKVYYGKIGFISPVAEFTPKTVETTQLRTDLVYRLRVVVENVDQGLRQGMPVTVLLRLKQLPSQTE